MAVTQYEFDPSYGYTLENLLNVSAPKEPKDFDAFWEQRYQRALKIDANPQTKLISENTSGWQVLGIRYTSTDNFIIQGWLLLPASGVIKRGFVVGHGYGGCDGPELKFPFKDAAILFLCFRGLALSAHPEISSEPYWHVLHNIDEKDKYILGGCVEDVWLGVNALLSLFPFLSGHIGYMGISFSGGIGALALAWDDRISKGHLNVPTFGNQVLRLRLQTHGSAYSVQQYYLNHKKQTIKVLRYYDAAIAAKRIKMPVHFACAQFDPCVAPPGQFAICNSVGSEKQLYTLEAGHHDYPNKHHQDVDLMQQLEVFFASLIGE